MEMPNSNYKNLASVVLENGGTSADNTITIPTSSASVFPATPFYATIMLTSVLANSSNSEIVYVTGSTTSGSNTIFSVTRAQRNTNAVSWSAGEAVLTHAIYREDVEAQSQGYYTAVLGSGAAFTITNNSAPTAPVLGNKIRVLFDTPITTASSITLAINGGTPYTIASVGATFATATTLNTSLTLSDDIVYDLVFTGNNWTLANASSLVGAQDVTANIPIIGSSTSLPANLVFVRTANIEDGAVTADKIDFTTIKTLLFSGTDSGGQSGTIVFTDSPTNYKYLQVFFHDDQSYENSIFIKNNYASNTTFCLQSAKASINGTTIFLLSKRMQLNSTGITRGIETLVTLVGGSTPTSSSTDALHVTEVYGYK